MVGRPTQVESVSQGMRKRCGGRGSKLVKYKKGCGGLGSRGSHHCFRLNGDLRVEKIGEVTHHSLGGITFTTPDFMPYLSIFWTKEGKSWNWTIVYTNGK